MSETPAQKIVMPGVDPEPDPVFTPDQAAEDEHAEKVGDEANRPIRSRRSYFVIASAFIAYISSMYLAVNGSGDIAAKVADAMMTYLTVVVPTYILSHSVDRSEMLTKIGESFKKG